MVLLFILLIIIFGLLLYTRYKRNLKIMKKNLTEDLSHNEILVDLVKSVIHSKEFLEYMNIKLNTIIVADDVLSRANQFIIPRVNKLLDDGEGDEAYDNPNNTFNIFNLRDLYKATVEVILKREDITNEIFEIYFACINTNIEELSKEENEAIEFNKQFNDDSDDYETTHPREPKTSEDTEEEIVDIEIDDLLSTGTVEDI